MSQQPPAQAPLSLPTLEDNRAIIPLANPDPSIDLTNIQGDVYPNFPKKVEKFVFFSIKEPDEFKAKLGEFIPHITTAAKVFGILSDVQNARVRNKGIPKPVPKERLVRLEQYQIGFSHAAFKLLNITGDLGDPDFAAGQLAQAKNVLGDRPTGTGPLDVDWDPVWKTHTAHGVIVAASESDETCQHAVGFARGHFGKSINVINVLHGKVRPGAEEGHEHFGFLDGISAPAIKGLVDPHPGQLQCEAGVIIMGHTNDPVQNRPDWTKDGSVMAFRKLQQLVPEFDRFLSENPAKDDGLTPDEKVALRGARMVGRWKSGTPIQLAPERDDPTIAANPDRNNNFDYSEVPNHGQANCPFSAHIRKTAPRTGFPGIVATTESLIIRAGIPYGPEVSPEEKSVQTTIHDRGLCFVSYQSTLDPGFVFLQNSWASNPGFPVVTGFTPGQDPIIGNTFTTNRIRDVTGENPAVPTAALEMPCDFVVARGGEYFFVPSMSTLKKLSHGEELPAGPVPPVLSIGRPPRVGPPAAVPSLG